MVNRFTFTHFFLMFLCPAVMLSGPAVAYNALVDKEEKRDEGYYAAKIKEEITGGETEVVLHDRTRVDILTATHAFEVDWAKSGKHFEAIGQALYYSIVTEKKPGIWLLVKDRDTDMKYVYRTAVVCAKYNISLNVYFAEKE